VIFRLMFDLFLCLYFLSSLSSTFVVTHPNPNSLFSESAATSRHLTQQLQDVKVLNFAGVTGSSGSTNGIGTNADFQNPYGVAISPDGVYALIADPESVLIRKIIISSASVTTFAGVAGSIGATNGMGTNSKFKFPRGVAISPNGNYALVADTSNHLIRRIVATTASVTTLAGIAGAAASTNGVGTFAQFYSPFAISISPDGIYALVADTNNHLIRKIIISSAGVTTLAGVAGSFDSTNGFGANSRFNSPSGITISFDGTYALVGDTGNHLIRQIIISTAAVRTLVGTAGSPGSTDGMGTNSKFNKPAGVSLSPDGVYALVADPWNHLIRQIIISTSSVSTLAGVAVSLGSNNGLGTNAKFNEAYGVTISPDGVYALVADTVNHLIRRIIINDITASPSFAPSTPTGNPTIPNTTLFSFGLKFGHEAILRSGKAILVDYLQDKRRGQFFIPFLCIPSHFSSLASSVLGKMLPISRIVNASRVSSASDPPLSSDSILIKWRPVSAVSGIGSWVPNKHMILSIPGGGVLVSWLVSLLSEEIKGFIVKGESVLYFLPHLQCTSRSFFTRFFRILWHTYDSILHLFWHLGLHLSQSDPLSSDTSRICSRSVQPASLSPQLGIRSLNRCVDK
jgi:DNA-binding beta-propeller fold protein YncE